MKLTKDDKTVEAVKPNTITRLKSQGWTPVEADEKHESQDESHGQGDSGASTRSKSRRGASGQDDA